MALFYTPMQAIQRTNSSIYGTNRGLCEAYKLGVCRTKLHPNCIQNRKGESQIFFKNLDYNYYWFSVKNNKRWTLKPIYQKFDPIYCASEFNEMLKQ